jgi:peptidoglycan/LPS O-acetylase OafA/YrhL
VLQLKMNVPHADLAVDFFFVLSGFVVAKAYEVKLTSSMPLSRFVMIRLVRLYPMILAGVVLGAFVLAVRSATAYPVTIEQFMIATACALLIVPTTAMRSFGPDLFPINNPHWSLFFE